MASVDEMQQYLRRDCLEITGIPVVPLDDPCNLVAEVCEILNVGLDENDISVAHRLRATKNTKDRIIVKFVKRNKRDEVYKQRSKLNGKTTHCLPTVNAEIQEGTIGTTAKIYINESLTAYRRRLFGKINAFKNANNYKFIWTTNGDNPFTKIRIFSYLTFHNDGRLSTILGPALKLHSQLSYILLNNNYKFVSNV